MMMIDIGGQEKRKYKELVREGKLVQYWLDEGIKSTTGKYQLKLPATNENKEWDEYIHPSYLDWSISPERQLAGLENKGKYNVHATANRMFHLGNLLHGAVQHLIPKAFYTGYNEIGLCIEKYKFKGTSDFIGYHNIMGWILFEYKSYGELQRDSTGGKALVKRLDDMLHQHRMLPVRTDKPGASEYASTSANISYSQMAKIRERLMNCERDMSAAEENHITQAFTYTWLISKTKCGVQRLTKGDRTVLVKRVIPTINWVCVCYIGKSKFETKEFWYPVKRHQHLIEKAEKNYRSVFKEAVKRGHIK